MTLKYTKQKNKNQFLLKLLTKIKNYIIGCIYKDPKILTREFNDMLTPILEKISLENKEGYVMGDLIIILTNHETDNPTSHVLGNVFSNSFFPYINIPTLHTSRSKTLIDNILHNCMNGNITADISDHLTQFLVTYYQVNSEKEPKKIRARTFKSLL